MRKLWKKNLIGKGKHRVQLVDEPLKKLVALVQSLSHVQLLETPWTAAWQVPLSFIMPAVSSNSWQVMLSNNLILCHPLLFLPSIFSTIRVFSNGSALCKRWTNIGASASAPFLPMNTQGWFPLGLTDLIPLHSKGLSRVFSSTTVQRYQFFSPQLSL